MEQVWINPNSIGTSVSRRKASSLDQDFVRIASELAPTVSPASGHPVVPDGWVLQMGDEGEADTMLKDTRGAALAYRANITQPTVPLYTGGWPPDPLSGQSGHTPPAPAGG